MKVILLAGGLGTRLSEETKIMPKPLVKIGRYQSNSYNEHIQFLRFQRFYYLWRI